MFYGKEFKINNKLTYKPSIKEITSEEQIMNKIIKDYILERLKKIKIKEKSARSCSQVVQWKENSYSKYSNTLVDSNDDIETTSNKLNTSPQSMHTITELSSSTKQE